MIAKKEIDFKKIKLLCLDVDGVLTDGRIIINDLGVETKFFHSRDGHGLKMLMRSGIKVALITGRKSEVLSRRADELGISDVYQGVKDKLLVYNELIKRLGLKMEETAMAGDDLVDLPVLKRCGLALAPADAVTEVLKVADFISLQKGGRGAVREMVEFILKGKNLWDELIAKYYQ